MDSSQAQSVSKLELFPDVCLGQWQVGLCWVVLPSSLCQPWWLSVHAAHCYGSLGRSHRPWLFFFFGVVSSIGGEQKMKVLKSRTSFLEHQRMTGLSQMYHTQSCLLNTWNVSATCTIFITNTKHSTITATMKKISSFPAKKQDTCLGKMSHRPSFLATCFLLQTFFFIEDRTYIFSYIYLLYTIRLGLCSLREAGGC